MVNTDVFKINISKEKTNLRQYGISDIEFEEKIREAEQDIENGNLFTLEEVMEGTLDALSNSISVLSNDDRTEVANIINSWRLGLA